MRGRAPVFEAAGYSLFGPLALNCAAPDEGNMHLLDAGRHRRSRRSGILRPLAAGDVRSCFAMTEPAPGAGSDPARCAPARRGWPAAGGSTAASGSSPAPTAPASPSCMARTSGEPGDARRRDDVPRRRRQPGHARSAGTSTPSTSACSAGTARSSSTTASSRDDARARRGGRGLRVRPGAARPGADDALHALARGRAPGARHRAATAPRSARRSARGSPTSAWSSR